MNGSVRFDAVLVVTLPPVVVASGSAAADPIWQDVINIPARNRVTVRVAFDDFPGRTVYHCHILDHEDAGMMGVVEAR
ncbi:hypothetical protein Y900_027315 [Mycolicibacterium aromaticivorans JS19b1 = JCM 16368]|uniref:Plastocyanin-like domain-containing protein n=1 Tax=Mycolicibacterium aromaticivorans JS19b1 = JCM 16368 TaxID=1440774 RepID=A0A064C8P9_9MYCO|nr:hypothetical protein Y900_027315 [Mycolicibacterium aromaticivorans JS19b1 = JCM 16368]